MKTGKVRAIACVLIAVFAVLCACGGGETTTPDPGTDGGNADAPNENQSKEGN